ncbi:MAG: DUF2924 domain-containing protein [Hyphomicrobiales bacterium]|jgi:hypothetical protein
MGGGAGKAERLADLAGADRAELQDTWSKTFGRRPPTRLSRQLFVLALSYQAQSGRSCGLSAEARQELGIARPDWIAGGPAVVRAQHPTHNTDRIDRPHLGAKFDANANAAPPAPRPSPRPVRRSIKPGTRLLREWQGQTHEVIADGGGGFIYRSETYRSLSAVARLITGTRWSGPTFFGIATKAQADRSAGRHDA